MKRLEAAIKTIAFGAPLWMVPPAHAHTVEEATRPGAVLQLWLAGLLISFGLAYARGLYRLAASARSHRAHVVRCGIRFAFGWSVLAVALLSPLATATSGLFSAHMLQHELMMVLAAPLMVLGRPLAILAWALPRSWSRAAGGSLRSSAIRVPWRIASTPLGATILHGAAIWLWHAPILFERAEASVAVHTVQHSVFLFSGLLFWWALLRPGRDAARIGRSLLCLFVTMLHTSALGVLLTFSQRVWYPLSTLAAAQSGLTPLEDQQLGGLIMWVPGGLSYVVAALVLVARWFSDDSPDSTRPAAWNLESR